MPRKVKTRLTHTDEAGKASMVDVSGKPVSAREAVAMGFIALQRPTLALIRQNQIQKGDVLAVARVAGIQAAKQTSQLVPLCHPLPLAKVSVEFAVERSGIRITSTARTVSQTGVEMEALAAVSVAALTIYDMCKAVDGKMRITDVQLVSKTKSGV